MYLDYFEFEKFPFTITPDTDFFCNLSSYKEALDVVQISIQSGEGFIKVVGEVGSGKTLLCRRLLEKLDDRYITAYIPNPSLSGPGLYKALAQELDIELPNRITQYDLLKVLNDRLIELRREDKKVIIVIDEAQVLPDESLESLRLLSNLETKTSKLLQIVLFGQPELDERLSQQNLRQLKQRIAFSYYLKPLKKKELLPYLMHHLSMAGYSQGALFSNKACDLMYQASQGIPRLINILSHKALMIAYAKGKKEVSGQAMKMAIRDTDSVSKKATKSSHVDYALYFVAFALIFVLGFEIYLTMGLPL